MEEKCTQGTKPSLDLLNSGLFGHTSIYGHALRIVALDMNLAQPIRLSRPQLNIELTWVFICLDRGFSFI